MVSPLPPAAAPVPSANTASLTVEVYGAFGNWLPKVARIASRLVADVAELERHAGRLACLVEPPAEGEQVQRLAIVVLDQIGALQRPRPAGSALQHVGQLADDLNGPLRTSLVLLDEQGVVTDKRKGQSGTP